MERRTFLGLLGLALAAPGAMLVRQSARARVTLTGPDGCSVEAETVQGAFDKMYQKRGGEGPHYFDGYSARVRGNGGPVEVCGLVQCYAQDDAVAYFDCHPDHKLFLARCSFAPEGGQIPPRRTVEVGHVSFR